MSLDESHEQNNACVKDEGGAIVLTEKPGALLRWMVAGLEMARVVTEFLTVLDCTHNAQTSHHEDTPRTQSTFLSHVKSLVKTISVMGNPFMDTSGDLLVLDTRVVAEISIVNSV